MKKYFSFNINPRKLLPLVLGILVIYSIINYLLLYNRLDQSEITVFGFVILMMILSLPLFYYTKKILIKGISIDNTPLNFKGKLLNYIINKIHLPFFSAVTFGIGFPYFQKEIISFYVNNTSINNQNLTFNASSIRLLKKGIKLLYIPTIIILIIRCNNNRIDLFIITLPFIYLLSIFSLIVYSRRWSINFGYKEYNIKLNSLFIDDLLYNLSFTIVSILSCGILLPFMSIWIIKHYVSHLVAYKNDVEAVSFFEEYNIFKDGGYLLGQMLLTLITLGIYSPWAINNSCKRLASKTGYIKQ
ncbi:MAG: YjgN family protein [Prolixibacteraceae bacterium]|nr:YjgN family protein [Prolixibacteraceae bacterium]